MNVTLIIIVMRMVVLMKMMNMQIFVLQMQILMHIGKLKGLRKY